MHYKKQYKWQVPVTMFSASSTSTKHMCTNTIKPNTQLVWSVCHNWWQTHLSETETYVNDSETYVNDSETYVMLEIYFSCQCLHDNQQDKALHGNMVCHCNCTVCTEDNLILSH